MGAQLKNFLGAALLSHKESWVVDVMSKIFQEIGYLGIRGTHTAASLIQKKLLEFINFEKELKECLFVCL